MGKASRPFLFIIDFDMHKSEILDIQDAEEQNIRFDLPLIKHNNSTPPPPRFTFQIEPPTIQRYSMAFRKVHAELLYGNSYLLNLTLPSRIHTNLTLEEIFVHSKADYKLLYPDKFVVFSPECFVKIQNGVISTYPMKGTISAEVPNASEMILSDPKETAEHATVVDLLRNDLSIVATKVKIEKFR